MKASAALQAREAARKAKALVRRKKCSRSGFWFTWQIG